MAKKSIAGSIYLFGIGLFLTLLGAGFCWLLLNSFGNAKDTREWDETPCLIIRSEVETKSVDRITKEYQWKVAYKYQYKGEDLIGELYEPRGQRWRKSIEEVKPFLEEYPKGSQTVCFVNPKQPEDTSKPRGAILTHDSRGAGYALAGPALFSICGIGLMIGSVRGMIKG